MEKIWEPVGEGQALFHQPRLKVLTLICKFAKTTPLSMLQNDQRKIIKEEYINEDDWILNKRGGKYLSNLYENNEEFRKEIINSVRDKKN